MNATSLFRSALTLCLLTSGATAQVWIEDFEGGSNDGDWEIWFSPFNTIETSGGNPNSYLRLNNIGGSSNCHYVEIFSNTAPAGFTGNWRASGVTDLALDVDKQVGPPNDVGAEWVITIGNDNGTPGNDADDCALELFTGMTPPNTPGWTSVSFAIPSSSTTIPPGWGTIGACGGGSVDALWNFVIQDVDYVNLRLDTNPAAFCLFNQWDLGVDNLRLEGQALATAYCFGDGSGTNCPCGNVGAADEGCGNSGGSGARLAVSGSNSAGTDDVTFTLTQGPGPVPGILFAGDALPNGGNGLIFGDGLRCAGGQIQRLGVQIMDGSGSATWGPGLGAQGNWSGGDTRYFQGWYRDVSGPCNGLFNTSHATELTFVP